MRIPTLRGVIDRRLLVYYRVAPDVLSKSPPPPEVSVRYFHAEQLVLE